MDISQLKERQLETPFLLMDLNKVKDKADLFKQYYSSQRILYAVKANSDEHVLKLLADMMISFDVASTYELSKLIELNVRPDRICFGNTIKKLNDIKVAFEKGIRTFTTDSVLDVKNIIKYAPGSKIFIRIELEHNDSCDWPLDKKFGCTVDELYEIVFLCAHEDIEVYGLSFHVGSQQQNPLEWEIAIKKTKDIILTLKEHGQQISAINLGGGFPAKYRDTVVEMDVLLEEIETYKADILKTIPEVIFYIEPGRGMVGDAGTLYTEVITYKNKKNFRWLYLDIGLYGGLAECANESIKYKITSRDELQETLIRTILVGPTCDSTDILYENTEYHLSKEITMGDWLTFHSTGAYTREYSSIGFNGFPPLKQYNILDNQFLSDL